MIQTDKLYLASGEEVIIEADRTKTGEGYLVRKVYYDCDTPHPGEDIIEVDGVFTAPLTLGMDEEIANKQKYLQEVNGDIAKARKNLQEYESLLVSLKDKNKPFNTLIQFINKEIGWFLIAGDTPTIVDFNSFISTNNGHELCVASLFSPIEGFKFGYKNQRTAIPFSTYGEAKEALRSVIVSQINKTTAFQHYFDIAKEHCIILPENILNEHKKRQKQRLTKGTVRLREEYSRKMDAITEQFKDTEGS